MSLIRLTDMDGKALYVKAEAIVLARRSRSEFDDEDHTEVFVNDDQPIEVRTKPGRVARLVRQATSWVELS